MQEGLELEYQTAMRAEKHAGSRGARALLLTQWVETGWRGCTGRAPTYAHTSAYSQNSKTKQRATIGGSDGVWA